MINGMPWVNTLKYTPKVTKHQNSRQLGGGWVGPTLSAISRQKVTLIILNGPLQYKLFNRGTIEYLTKQA